MGCDIHLHGEVKINGVWRHWCAPSINRDYDLFAKMAGVRNYGRIEPIADVRGLPPDATFETMFDYNRWKEDAHSMSWLSGEEIAEVGKWWEEEGRERSPGSFHSFEMHVIGFLLGNGWDVKSDPRGNPEGVEDSRVVFWFDN